MMPMDEVLRGRFRAFHDPAQDPGPLAAALLVASCDRPEFDAQVVEAALAELAGHAAPYVSDHAELSAQVAGLGFYLREVAGLQGDTDRYYERDNSLIDRVLATGRGIPITLAVIYVEVGRRLGLLGEGVNFPGHFLVRFHPRETTEAACLLDPFIGQILTSADCQDLLSRLHGEGQILGPEHLEAARGQQVLVRMLNNLKQLALAEGDPLALIRHSEWIQAADPSMRLEYRDRALIYEQMGDFDAAVTEWQALLSGLVDDDARKQLQGRIAELERRARAGRIIH